jgi:V8-like Glu-specific endopeptidase
MKRNYSTKTLKFSLALVLVITLMSISAHSQVVTRRLMKPDQSREVDIKQLRFYSSELPNQKELNSKMEEQVARGEDPVFGHPVPVDVTIRNDEWKRDIKKGVRIWQTGISSKGAKALTVSFDKLTLLEGSEIFIYNISRTTVMGPITHSQVRNSAYLTDWIDGDSLIVEVVEPFRNFRTTSLHIKSLLHVLGVKDVGGIAGAILQCHENIACPVGAPFLEESNAIAIIVDAAQGRRLCSGTMINNACQNLLPSLLTAFHCLDANESLVLEPNEIANANNWVVSFGFRNTSCNSSGETERVSISGAQVLTTSEPSDALIVQLSQRPNVSSNVKYLGWSRLQTPAPTSVRSLHHPSGSTMRIAIDNDAAVLSDNTRTSDTRQNYWRVSFDVGTIQGGSSGASYLNQDRRIVGQHMSSNRTCTVGDRQGWAGRMDVSWNNGLQPSLSDDLTVTQTNTIGIPSLNLPDVICGFVPLGINWNGITNMSLSGGSIVGVQGSNQGFGLEPIPNFSGSGSIDLQLTPNGITCNAPLVIRKDFHVGNPSPPSVQFANDWFPCENWLIANGNSNNTYQWIIHRYGYNQYFSGQNVLIQNFNASEFFWYELTVTNSCGSTTVSGSGTLNGCNGPFLKGNDGSINALTSKIYKPTLSISPNPATNEVTLDLKEISPRLMNTLCDVNIVNQMGQTVISQKLIVENTIRLDISQLTNGFYVAQVRGENGLFLSQKLIVNRK